MASFFRRLAMHASLVRAVPRLRFPKVGRPYPVIPRFETGALPAQIGISDAMIRRIVAAWRLNVPEQPEDTIWGRFADMNRAFVTALGQGDTAALREMLGAMLANHLTAGMSYGFSPDNEFRQRLRKGFSSRDYFRCKLSDYILAFAEALAVKPAWSNHQTSPEDYVAELKADPAPLIAAIEAACGLSLEAPPDGTPSVAWFGAKPYNLDSIRHAYPVVLMRQIGVGGDEPILEIGGGFGNVARYFAMAGYRDYTIIDLPIVTALQAAYLAAALGEDRVVLDGEEDNAAEKGRVRIVAASRKADLAPRYRAVLNMDSLPEIPAAEAAAYVELIRDRADLFLSINQEARRAHRAGGPAQNSVPELVAAAGGFTRLRRSPNWMDQGYVEELYETVGGEDRQS